MATYDYNSTQQANKEESGKYDARKISRSLNKALINYNCTGTESSGQTIHLWTLPHGSTIHGWSMIADDATASVSIGTPAEPALIADSISTSYLIQSGSALVSIPKGVDIIATFGGVSVVSSDVILFEISYSTNT